MHRVDADAHNSDRGVSRDAQLLRQHQPRASSRPRRALCLAPEVDRPGSTSPRKAISMKLSPPPTPVVPGSRRTQKKGHVQEYLNRKLKELEQRDRSPHSRFASMERAFQFGPGPSRAPIHRRALSNQPRSSPASPHRSENSRVENSPAVKSRPASRGTSPTANTPHTPHNARLVIRDHPPDRQLSSEKLPTMTTAASLEPMDDRNTLITFVMKHYGKFNDCPMTTLDFYKVGTLIGRGAFGKVISAVQKLTGVTVALKAIDKEYIADEHHRKKVFQEVFLLNKVRHKRVIKILEVFESTNHLLIATEFAPGGDLLQHVRSKRRLTELEAKPLFRQIVEGAIAIHQCGVLHRDFKLDNVLLDTARRSVKICDFGVSRVMRKGQKVNEQCGTPAYIAPEIIADRGYEGFYSDIWSLGVCLYAMISGTVPFKAQTLKKLHKLVLTARYEIPKELSTEAKDLIARMLHLVPVHRIPLEDVLNHAWFTAYPAPDQYCDISTTDADSIDKAVVAQVKSLGFPQEHVITGLRLNEMNHATACYYTLHSSFT